MAEKYGVNSSDIARQYFPLDIRPQTKALNISQLKLRTYELARDLLHEYRRSVVLRWKTRIMFRPKSKRFALETSAGEGLMKRLMCAAAMMVVAMVAMADREVPVDAGSAVDNLAVEHNIAHFVWDQEMNS
ncbi:MAG: hypothetical protein U5O39_06105 [Gammaproteobacteria bacterium]|nr:hypothetical protein [Gammaproteobacteria bacterium]